MEVMAGLLAQRVCSMNEHFFGGSTCSGKGLVMASKLVGLLLRAGQPWFLSQLRLGSMGLRGRTSQKSAGGVQSPGSEIRPGLLGVEGWLTVPWKKAEMVQPLGGLRGEPRCCWEL